LFGAIEFELHKSVKRGHLKKGAITYVKARRPLIPSSNPPQGPKSAFGNPFVGVPVVIAGQPDVIPAERSDVSEQRVVDGTTLPESIHGSLEVHGIPERDGGDHEIQAAGAVALVFIGAIADLAEAMKEHGPRERIARFSLIECRR
jgi:hypothetical protein